MLCHRLNGNCGYLHIFHLSNSQDNCYFEHWLTFNVLRPRVSLHPLEADGLLPGRLPDSEDWGGDLWHNQHEAKRQEQCKYSCIWLCLKDGTLLLCQSPHSSFSYCVTERPGLHGRHRLQGSTVWGVEDIRVQDALVCLPVVIEWKFTLTWSPYKSWMFLCSNILKIVFFWFLLFPSPNNNSI